MTAGHGVAHAEEDPARAEEIHAVQLWVAQPAATRAGPAAFEHHAELPRLELGGGKGTVLVGAFGGVDSPARRDTEHMGVELTLQGPDTEVPLRPDYEHALAGPGGAGTGSGSTASRWSRGHWPTSGWAATSALSRWTPRRVPCFWAVCRSPSPSSCGGTSSGAAAKELSEAEAAVDGLRRSLVGHVRSSLSRIEVLDGPPGSYLPVGPSPAG